MPFFENFYPFIKENFLKNYDAILDFANKKNIEFNSQTKNFKTGFYGMNVNLNYVAIIEKLNKTKEFIESL
jgi:cell division protein YceG involved in septum cleavage